MPWKESSAMDERLKFVADHLSGRWSKKALCAHYGISRPTGDKWIRRYEEFGPSGLGERSRRPHGHPWTTSPDVVGRIVEYKKKHQSFGPKKVVEGLRELHPGPEAPAVLRLARSGYALPPKTEDRGFLIQIVAGLSS